MAAAKPAVARAWSVWTAVRSARWFPVEAAGFLVLFGLYYVGRGLPEDRVPLATRNALWIINRERDLGIFRELSWQEYSIARGWLREFSNFMYSYLHLPTLAVVGCLLFTADARKYRVIRNAVLFSGFLAMAIYWFVPVTPPRLLAEAGHDLGFVDPIGPGRLKPGPMTNHYAAIPSYHFGWILLLVIGIWWTAPSIALRFVSAGFLVAMTWSIIATANHYFLDLAAGGVMVLLGLTLALLFERALEQRPQLAGRVSLRCGPVRFPF